MNADAAMLEPDPIEIDPRPCGECGRTIDQHRRVDTPEGPEFFCVKVPAPTDDIDTDELERLAELRRQQEVADIVARVEAMSSPRGGGEPPLPDSPADYGLPIDVGLDGTKYSQAQPPAQLSLICPPAWRDVPLEPMRWLATHRIPAGDATILSGDGGGGKTTVALQLAVSVERGLGDWLGTVCESGPVIFVSAEKPEHEMRRRLQRVARKRGIEPDDIAGLHFHFASPENCLLAVARADGTMWPTPLFESLAITAAAIRPALIVVDGIAATFGGNQNDRVGATLSSSSSTSRSKSRRSDWMVSTLRPSRS
jgi:AAA domain